MTPDRRSLFRTEATSRVKDLLRASYYPAMRVALLFVLLLVPVQESAPRQDSAVQALPAGVLRQFGDNKFRHDSGITQGVFSPDGSSLYTCSYDKTVRAWEASTGRERFRLVGHPDLIRAIAVSKDGKTLASGGQTGVVRLWNLESKVETGKLSGHTGSVVSGSVSKSPLTDSP